MSAPAQKRVPAPTGEHVMKRDSAGHRATVTAAVEHGLDRLEIYSLAARGFLLAITLIAAISVLSNLAG